MRYYFTTYSFVVFSSFRNRCGLVMAGVVDITTDSLGSLAIAALAVLIKASKTLVYAAWEKNRLATSIKLVFKKGNILFVLIDNYDSFTWNLWHFLSDRC